MFRLGVCVLEVHAIFHGKVQGVGFRHTTLKLARSMDLKGFVRNKADGTVELLAQGERKQLDQLLDGLHQAFGTRWIERVEQDFHTSERKYDRFIISS